MKKSFGNISGNKLIAASVFLSLIAARPAAQAAALEEARVSHVIQDVRLLATNAAPRPAAVNDNVRQGTAVRTGGQSRAELTFSDLTITRIGENTVFSFKGGSREVTLDSGAILLQVPQGAEAAKIRTAAVTASITGGTGLMNSNKGYPSKLYMMEGIGELCLNSGECVTAHGGEMVMEDGGQLSKPQKFNAKLLFQTSPLLQDFPPLPNEPLFFENFNDVGQGGTPPPQKDPIDIISQVQGATGATGGTGSTAGKFGPPVTISSPDPYVITSGTQINTDPTIMTNGVTDEGKLYRGTAVDGFPTQYLFNEAPTSFDDLVFSGPQNNLPIAIFKFAHLQLAGDPIVTIPSGATTFLALVSVGDITSAGPGGTLTFAGITRLDFITQNGSINLGPEISFANLSHLEMYARGATSNLTLGSAISSVDVVKLYAGNSIQVNGNISTTEFDVIAGGDYLFGSGTINTTNVDIQALGNANIDASQFPDFTGDATFTAGATLTITNFGGGTFSGNSLTGSGATINLTPSKSSTFDFSNSSFVTFTAGTGGIQAPSIDFLGTNLTLVSGADINVGSIIDSGGGNSATISAATSFNAGSDVQALNLTAGTTVDTGGFLVVYDTLTAGGNINVGGFLQATTIDAPSSVLTVQSVIAPNLLNEGAALQHTFNVDSINCAGIDFNGNQFDGIGGLSSGGRLTINANTILFNNNDLNSPAGGPVGIRFANFNGADSGAFTGGGPSEGGDGGVFIVNATGDITANSGADITATTGVNSDAGVYSGAGGSVTLLSTGGMVTVNDRIEVSSDDNKNQRQSASGGTILLQSNLTTGQGITVGANAQLLAFLSPNAPGPGGSITLSTMGSNITVAPGAVIEADRGTITMDQTDPPGSTSLISIEGATLTCQILHITGVGDVNIGTTDHVTINAVSVSLSATNTLNLGDVTIGSQNGDASGDVTLSAGQISGPGGVEIDRTAGSNVSITTVHDLTLQNDLSITIDNSGSSSLNGINAITSGANITLDIGGALTINSGGLILHILNNEGGHIDVGGNISVTTGGDLTATSIDSFINNRNGGSIGTGGNMTFTIGGAIATTESASFITTNRNDGAGGGTMGSNVAMSITAASVSVGGSFIADVSTNTGGHIAGNSTITADIAGDFLVQADAGFQIENGGFNIGDAFLAGGTIDGNALLTVNAANITVNDTKFGFSAGIFNLGGGTIHGNAGIDFNVSGDITTQPDAFFDIANGNNGFGTPAGTIDGNATIHVAASNLSVHLVDIGLESSIDNRGGGTIDGNAAITFDISGDITTDSDTFFGIYNDSDGKSLSGNINGDATIDVTASNVSANNFELEIFNDSGAIGGKATMTLGASGDFTPEVALFVIHNSQGTIGSDAVIKLMDAPNISVNGALEFRIDNRDGTIGGNATIDVVANSIIVGEDLNAYIDNTGGSIGGISAGSRPSSGGTGTVTVESFGSITVSGRLNVNGTVLADDDVEVGTLSVTNLDTQGNNLVVHSGGITRFSIPGETPPDLLHTISARFITSDGGINFDGVAADGDFSPATNGGRLTINANTLTFGQTAVVGGFPVIQGPVSFNGGDGSSTFGPGSGGTFTANVTNNITVDADIEATSGTIPPSGGGDASNGGFASGAGGTVNLNSTNGTVAVDNRIQVSSAEPTSTVAPFRQSAQGGNIGITSGKTSGNAINISNTAQLLALLDASAPGPGGNITIVATKPGNNGSNGSSIVIENTAGPTGNRIEADGGTVEIRHDGASGSISITSANIAADIVKIGALGSNGTLTIGGGTLSADTILKLYASGSSGILHFTADASLSSGTAMHLAANTITIDPGFTVSINGAGGAANIYTNNPDYNFTPGGGYTGPPPNTSNGSFGGTNGALDPVPLGGEPPFGAGAVASSASSIPKSSVPSVPKGSLPSSHNSRAPVDRTVSQVSQRSAPFRP